MNVELRVNGFSYIASFPDRDIKDIHLPLLHRLTQLFKQKQREHQQRLVVFLAAPPGIGKSTLTEFWQILAKQDTELQDFQGLPMDGFHHYNSYLDEHHLRGRKGAPDTYNLELLKEYLAELQKPQATWPAYDRNLHDPVQDAIEVTAPIVVIEGNWLLLQEAGWQDLINRCDYSIFIAGDINNLKQRLVSRKMKGGLSKEDAERFFEKSDGPNVMRVLERSHQADLMLMMQEDGSYLIHQPRA
ncbi:nucleoside/nucleotide kinase family protein [Budvicia aquatica]|uniref:Nucleoside/nucleotide kinase family protein n=1 Tax=Budvicia aquatica TaxID=82979 RepID=A0A2C6C7A7_9GAMM|nr:nucleoside/nucleotide kinase family protein [Budvicia aquatica]PHI32210.1 nucleoside/nucleotide kinase family protein [Budvicia aquatica]VFS53116.1 Pantothenate kinase [Budvicia aquatica]